MHTRFLLRLIGTGLIGLLAVPGATFAQTEPSMRVERTPMYVVTLDVGPAVGDMSSPMGGMHDQSGNMAMMGGESMAHTMDQGMPANHLIAVQVTRADTGAVATDLMPNIRITDKDSGVSRDLPDVMGMYDMSMGPSDVHFGQNVFLADGTYQVMVMLAPTETAQFRDVSVVGNAMMDNGMEHSMGMSDGTAP